MHIYVESLTTLLGRNEKRSEICVKVGKCFRNGDNSMFVEINEGEGVYIQIIRTNESDYEYLISFFLLIR